MNQQENDQQTVIEDLTVKSVAQQEVKGGPRTLERNDSMQILLNTTY